MLFLPCSSQCCCFLVPPVHKSAYPGQCNIQRVQAHVGKADPEPPELGTMAGRPRRDVKPHLAQHPVPQPELAGDGGLAEEPPHIHPH
jgi:hypothetical protein